MFDLLTKFLNKLKRSNKSDKKSEFIGPSKEDCIKLIRTSPLEWNKLKSENPSWIPNLDEIDFKNTDLFGVDLRNCSLVKADLSKTINLQEKIFGGSDLNGAKLPEGFHFAGLITVRELSIGSSTIFIMILVLCFYCWITVASTNDLKFLTNSGQSILPFINLSLPIRGFYWVVPLILFAFYIYFHFNLKKLWDELSEFPAYFPDGKSIEQKTYPWLINDLVANYMCLLKKEKGTFSKLQNILIILLVWGIIPLTVFIIWFKALINHGLLISFVHSAILSICLAFGVIFFQTACRTMKCNSDENKKLCSFKCIFSISLVSLFLAAFINANSNFGYSYHFDDGAEIVKKPNNWSAIEKYIKSLKPNDEKFNEKLYNILKPIKVFNPPTMNLKNIQAGGAFLANVNLTRINLQNAVLYGANLQNAVLYNANFQYADLSSANLQNADLSTTDLQHAILYKTNLQHANLHFANLQKNKLWHTYLQYSDLNLAQLQNTVLYRANLQYANLYETDLQYARLYYADLQHANLSYANLKYAHLESTRLQHANLSYTYLENTDLYATEGLTYNQLKLAIIDEKTKLPGNLLKYRKELLKISKENLQQLKSQQYY